MTKSESRIGFVLGDTGKGTSQLIASGAHPQVVVVHNNTDHAWQIHNACGDDTIVVLRIIPTESIVQQNESPQKRGEEWCTAMAAYFMICPWAYFLIGPPLMPPDDWTAEFWIYCINWMAQRGYLGVVCHFGEGNPNVPSAGFDGWAPMWRVVDLAAKYGFILGPQAYWVDSNMMLSDDWHAFRIFRVFRDYPGHFPPGTRIVHTEFGIDLRNGLGWHTALGGDGSKYFKGLVAASDRFRDAEYPPGVTFEGFAIFALHEIQLWVDFNFWDIYPDLLEQIKSEMTIVEVPPDEPDEPEAGEYVMRYPKNGWINMRILPEISDQARVIDQFLPEDSVTIEGADLDLIGVRDKFIWVNGTKQNPCKKGWVAAWLLQRKE